MKVLDIAVDAIDLAPNVRSVIDDEADEELAASLDVSGPLQPVRVRPDLGSPGRYVLVIGSRRLAAAMLAGHSTIPAVIDDRVPDPKRDAIEQLTENIQRQDLNPMDVAQALQRILSGDPTLNAARLGRKLGKNPGWVHRHLGLLRLAPGVQRRLVRGTITLSHVVPIVSAPPDEQERLARMAEAGASSKAIEAASFPSLSELTMRFGPTTLQVSRCPDDSRYGRIQIVSDEPFTTLDIEAAALRKLAKAIGALAAAIEAEHGHEPRTRERIRPTAYPETRRPAKRPRKAKVPA